MSEISAPFFKHESFGAVDGPGVRLVIFLQGCPLRCIYCHNPESWEINKKVKTITPSEVINLYNKNKTFYANGGITISGGEPLIHLDFCLELAKICKEKNISLVLDTSGVGFNKNNIEKYRQLAHLVDIWLIDIKHINPSKHKMITGVDNQNEIDLINFLEKEKGHYWVRQVLVPGYTDDPNDLRQLGKFLKGLKCMLKFELLPYHNMAIPKYENLKIKYGLKDLQPPSKDAIKEAMQYIKEGMNK